MEQKLNLRIVISCVTFETVKVVEPIKYYRADRAYLIHWTPKEPYTSYLKEVKRQLDEEEIEYVDKQCDILSFSAIAHELLSIIRSEMQLGNHVYVNVGAGPQIYAAAGMMACMIEGAYPFFNRTEKYTVEDLSLYNDKNGRPIGLSKKVYDPDVLPIFKIEIPENNVVSAFKVWQNRIEKGWDMTDTLIVEDLEKNELMKKIYEPKRKLKKVSFAAKMRYRRQYLDKWIEEGWVEKVGKGRYEITEFGEVAGIVFSKDRKKLSPSYP